MERNFYTFKGSSLKRLLSLIVTLHCCVLGGCFTCLSSWCLGEDTYERLMHPKGIGEYWEKPDKTIEGWRSDWVACGGRPNGDYLPYKPDGPGDKDFDDAYKKKEKHLWICMTQKGYKFNGKYWPE